MTTTFRIVPLFLATILLAAGCATAHVSADGASENVAQVEVPEGEMPAAWDRGEKKASLSPEAEGIFHAMRTLPLGFSAAMDLDALVRSGIFEDRTLDPNGYSLVQLISPYVSEVSVMKSHLNRPLAEAVVLATLLDKTLESYDVKRMGAVWVPANPENILQSIMKNPWQETVFILGTDVSAEDTVSVETAMDAVLRLSKKSEETLAKDAVATPATSQATSNDSADESDAPGESLIPDFSMKDGVFCLGAENSASEENGENPSVERYCMTSGNGYVAIGRESPLKRTLAALRSAATSPTADAVEFGYIHMFLPSLGLMELSVTPDATGEMDLSLRGNFATQERAQEVAQMIEMGIARRTQAKAEFTETVAATIEEMRQTMATTEGVPAKMVKVASEMTLASVMDPHGVGLGAPENVAFQKDGQNLVLTIKFPAQHMEHLIATIRNVRAVRYQVLIGSFGALSSIVEKSKAHQGAKSSDETALTETSDATGEAKSVEQP